MKKKTLSPLLTSVATAASIVAGSAALGSNLPRGMNVQPLAGSCRIGTFPQTSKAGGYNELCEVMQDSEKCLAFIKGHFHQKNDIVTTSKTHDLPKLQYCLEVLQHDLGLGAVESGD